MVARRLLESSWFNVSFITGCGLSLVPPRELSMSSDLDDTWARA